MERGVTLAAPFIFDQNIVSGGTAILSETVSSVKNPSRLAVRLYTDA